MGKLSVEEDKSPIVESRISDGAQGLHRRVEGLE